MEFKKHKIIFLEDSRGKITVNKKQGNVFVLSDEEIKEEDWYYISGKIRKCIKIESDLYAEDGAISVEEFCTKIIASTNPELNLPFPTDEYLQEYCKNPQDEVEVEYELKPYTHINYNFDGSVKNGVHTHKEYLKIYPDNTINCRLISEDKQLYTLNEVISLLSERDVYLYNHYTTYIKKGQPIIPIKEFIEESHEYLFGRKI